MSFTDYGSIVAKNSKIIQKDFFMDMKESVGFTLGKVKYPNGEYTKTDIMDNYFSYMGDKNFLVCIYKTFVTFISNGIIIKELYDLKDINYNRPYERMSLHFNINEIQVNIKRLINDCRKFKLRFCYKGDVYECLYGYGVDTKEKYWKSINKKEKRYIHKWYKLNFNKSLN